MYVSTSPRLSRLHTTTENKKQKKNKVEIPQCDHTQINTTQINMQNDQRSKSSINKNRAEMRDVMTVYYYFFIFIFIFFLIVTIVRDKIK